MEFVMEFGTSVSFGRVRAPSFLSYFFPGTHLHGRPRRAAARDPSPIQLAEKRAVDIVGAILGLLILAPLLIGISVAIKATSQGPVFFRQKRYGYHNRRFRIFKFRTMFIHLGDDKGTQQATADDPRVTSLGRI